MRATLDGSRALPELHADAVAVSAFRAMPDGTGRQYTVSESTSDNKWRAINHHLRMAHACGYVRPSCGGCECYAVLDILDANDDVIQDFCIPTNRAFAWWYRKLHLRVVDVEAEVAKCYGRDA